LVTETDTEVENLLISVLSKEFPNHKFIAEESQSSGKRTELTDDPTWIIDPIDGTMNFVHSFPHACVSIALLIKKTTEIGIIYNPVLQQLFTARKGQGAFYNGNQIWVSGQKDIRKSLLVAECTIHGDEKLAVTIDNLEKIFKVAHGFRSLGSSALDMAMVALGAADASYDYGVHAWDMAAADLIVREAGGVVIDPAGGPLDIMSRRVLVASSPELAQEYAKLLTQFYPQPRD